jgi:DNA-binding NtrC family response regulator
MDEKKRVITVDDSRTQVKMLRFTLADLPVEVDSTTDPKEGLEMISQKVYDLLILDLEMPEINGVQFLKKMQQMNISVPVIILTGKTDDRLVFGIMSQFKNVVNYLVKPYLKEELLKNARKILKLPA